MLLKYIGTRRHIANDIEHKRYAFGKDNDYTCEVPESGAIKLLKSGVYVPVDKVVEKIVEKVVEKVVVKEAPKRIVKPKVKEVKDESISDAQ